LHLGRLRRSHLRAGRRRLPGAANLEQRVPDPGRAACLLGAALGEGCARTPPLAGRTRRMPGPPAASLTRMRILVTGGAGFIGSHFVKRLAAQGDAVVVLDKLTYSGNLANLENVEHEFHQGDIADSAAVENAAKGCDAIVNFAAETHVDRSILGA